MYRIYRFAVKKVAVVVFLGAAASALPFADNAPTWTKEPSTFRGAGFLASESEARSKFDISECRNGKYDEKLCFFYFSLADTHIMELLTFQKDTFVDVSGIFSPDNFSTVLDMFTERYDAASSRIALTELFRTDPVSRSAPGCKK
jgi:hypothetical protein